MRSVIRRSLYLLAGLGLLLASFHGVENLRGRAAWNRWRSAEERAGMRYDPASYAPPPVAEADNFVTALAEGKASKELPPLPSAGPAVGDWRIGRRVDLSGLGKPLVGPELTGFLAATEPALGALAAAARRPGCRVIADHGNPSSLPLQLGLREPARALRLRALVRLREGRAEAALEDILTGLRMVRHYQQEPHLISQLLRIYWANQFLQPVWEGLRDRAWNEPQLARLEAALAPIDLVGGLRLAWRFERAMNVATWTRHADVSVDSLFPAEAPWATRALRRLFLPNGWKWQNLRTLDRMHRDLLEAPLDVEGHRIDPARFRHAQAQLLAGRTPYSWLAMNALPPLWGQTPRMARIATGLDHARIACALERFRLSRGHHPDNLDELAPGFLAAVPRDLVTGALPRYVRADRVYRLYSFGWDAVDDGGQAAVPSKEGSWADSRGDWVWADRP